MSLELQTGLPSIKLLQTYLKDKCAVEVKLTTGDTFTGTLTWQDPDCICLSVDEQPIVMWRSALVYIRAI